MINRQVYGPGLYNSDNFPNGLADIAKNMDVLVDYFEQRYRYWFLQPALKLTENSDNGFVVMSILIPYPDMVAQLKGLTLSKQGEKPLENRYFAGLDEVFPNYKDEIYVPIKTLLYRNLRSEMAHKSFISKNVTFSDDIHYPFLPDQTRTSVVVSPRYWCYVVFAHFTNYMTELKNPANEEERNTFKKNLLQGILL